MKRDEDRRRKESGEGGEREQPDLPFMALGEESNHGLEPKLSGKKPFVPPTATSKMR
jgi:hypothetical protein